MCVSARLWPSLRSQPGASLRPWPQSATALPESFCADGSASPCCPAGSPIAIASTALKAGAKVPLKLPAGAAALKGNQMDIEINITADFTKPGVAAGTKPRQPVAFAFASYSSKSFRPPAWLDLGCTMQLPMQFPNSRRLALPNSEMLSLMVRCLLVVQGCL